MFQLASSRGEEAPDLHSDNPDMKHFTYHNCKAKGDKPLVSQPSTRHDCKSGWSDASRREAQYATSPWLQLSFSGNFLCFQRCLACNRNLVQLRKAGRMEGEEVGRWNRMSHTHEGLNLSPFKKHFVILPEGIFVRKKIFIHETQR